MKVHEYQAKEILRRFAVTVPSGKVATNAEEAYEIAKEIGERVVIKAQVHAGGRGKAGGVKIAKNPDEAREIAAKMIGMTLISPQTGKDGRVVRKVLVTEVSSIEKEYYLSILLDRSKAKLVIMASKEGGVEIEEVAKNTPEKIVKEWVDPLFGIQPYQARKVAFSLGFSGEAFKEAVILIMNLYKAHVSSDASLTEINPLILTNDGHVVALDAKMTFDDNALFRHEDIKEMRDILEEDPLEVEASRYDLNYIRLDGTIGCMVNGAGLAMATMDIIKHHGGNPANFLDVGGSATTERVRNAFKLLISDKKVRAVLINIFGGIVRCDTIAEGVIEAAKDVALKLPLVVRLEGTNVERGKSLLRDSGMGMAILDSLDEAAKKVVELGG